MTRIVTLLKLDMLSHCVHAEMVGKRGKRLVQIADVGIAHKLRCRCRIGEATSAETRLWLEGRDTSLRSSQ